MSEQNYTKTILVSAFQDEFLLEILARLHISKIQNFNLKQTEVFEDQNSILRQTGLFQRSGTPIRNRPKSETPFQGRPLSPELHFKVWNSTLRRTTGPEFRGGPGLEFRGRPVFQRSGKSGPSYFKGPELKADRR
ncbi:hypothetical protein RCL_jg9913.t1 [Rhizophagus clarus]|uniref:Uncharacterized protein n=1 Tax=Rhizophagus clarus TaxID=94130 RepID=A0A8H3KR32_9GLOM|nr:hypothetical protein RCL_jg9913.t1 [Rhizophagus clarus]